jgi:hypothetical protein
MAPLTPLPEPLSEPLALFAAAPLRPWQAVAIVCLLGLLVFWLWRRRRRPAAQAVTAAAPVPAAPPPPGGFAARVRELEQRHLDAGSYRQGCHELDSEVRSTLEQETRREVEALTATEVAALFADPRIGDFAARLRDLRFARREPSRDGFRSLCTEARKLFEGKQRHQTRARGKARGT